MHAAKPANTATGHVSVRTSEAPYPFTNTPRVRTPSRAARTVPWRLTSTSKRDCRRSSSSTVETGGPDNAVPIPNRLTERASRQDRGICLARISSTEMSEAGRGAA
jgi:hypothetical protein